MADVIKTIGASGSGADFTTWQAWYNARVGGAGDRYIGEVITTTGGLSSGLNTSSNALPMGLVLRAAAGIEFDPTDPTKPHAIISASNGIGIPATGVFNLTLENIEVLATSVAPTSVLINMGGSTQRLVIKKCWLRGGRNGAQNAVTGSTTLIEDSIIQGSYRAGVHATFAGATVRNTVITGCNIENGTTSAYCGIRKDLAGTVIDNVVAYGNNNADFFGATTAATVSYMASGDGTASGTGALTGVTSAAFEDYAGNVFTAKAAGVLDGTGPSGNDRGLVTASNPTVMLLTPAADATLSRDVATNTGNIAITGSCANLTAGAEIEARFNGGAWQVIDDTPTTSFAGTLTGQTPGVGAVEVRISNFPAATDSHANVAVAAKVLFWGQSNFSGRANNAQSYTGPANWWRKRTVENNNVVAGSDPFDTYTANGSIFPLLATALTAALDCPVLFIGVAAGGTSVAQWQPGQSLNTRMLTYYNAEAATGHAEAVVSWIGEGDSVLATAEADYKSRYNTVIDQLRTLTGAKSLLVAISGENTTGYANVRQWISDIAATSANTIPNEVQMWPLFQKIHYETDTETALAANAVFEGMMSGFYAPPVQEPVAVPAVQNSRAVVPAVVVAQSLQSVPAVSLSRSPVASVVVAQTPAAVAAVQVSRGVVQTVDVEAAGSQVPIAVPAVQFGRASVPPVVSNQVAVSVTAVQVDGGAVAVVAVNQIPAAVPAVQVGRGVVQTVDVETAGAQVVVAVPAVGMAYAVRQSVSMDLTVQGVPARQVSRAKAVEYIPVAIDPGLVRFTPVITRATLVP